jgi:hypothetical protein
MDQKLVKSLLIGAAAGAALTVFNRPKRFDLEGKSVVVTGGARGLGLVLARQLVD